MRLRGGASILVPPACRGERLEGERSAVPKRTDGKRKLIAGGGHFAAEGVVKGGAHVVARLEERVGIRQREVAKARWIASQKAGSRLHLVQRVEVTGGGETDLERSELAIGAKEVVGEVHQTV